MAKKELTQTEKVLKHLLRKGSITSWEAIEKYGITRLSARIFELRELGHEIKSHKIITSKEFNFVKYTMKKY